MLKVTLLCLFVLMAATAGVVAEDNASATRDLDKYPIRFAVIGDRTGEAQPGIYEQIVAEIERLKPEFVITVGDMIEGPVPDSAAWDKLWQEYREILGQLSMPIYFVPGNNDIWSDDDVKHWVQHIGREPHYSFDYDALHIVVLDNSRWESIDEFPVEQVEWLRNDLEANRAAAKTLVFHHKPFWYRTVADNKPGTLHKLFVANGVDGVFSGHFHRYFVGEFDGVKYTNVGSSGGSMRRSSWDPDFHFMWVTVSAQDIAIAPIQINGVLPWQEVSVADVRYSETARRLGIAFSNQAPVAEGSLSVAATTIEVDIKNVSDKIALRDSVGWVVPDGWTVEPMSLAVTLEPGETGSFEFVVSSSGSLYPLPEIAVDFPFKEETSFEVRRELRVARQAVCSEAPTSPTIDGNLAEAIWQKPSTGLLAGDGSLSDMDSTLFYFAHDDENLYLGVYCVENRVDSMRANMTGRDDKLYNEDCVGFLYRPVGGEDAVYQLYVNPLGTVFDQKITQGTDGYWSGNETWDGVYETAASIGENSWTVEVRIPLAQFGAAIKPGQKWDFNFRRKQYRLESAGGWQIPHAYDPSGFGKLIMQ